ncbi:MAG: helix-turn-helix domain-containing protein [Desulfobacteraceae bacterium]|nr:helix-turn-helix domain-containing protein [Desulfobacteraceae bacterium]
MKLSEYYTVEQVAEFFRVTRSTVANAISRGTIKNKYFGMKKVVIHKNEIERLGKSWKIRKKIIKRPSLKPGEYYTIDQVAEILGITISIIFNAIGLGVIKVEYLDKKKIAIHESQIEQLKAHRADHKTDAKKKAQHKLLAAGVEYYRNPPPGTPRGLSKHPGMWRRGWWYRRKYYGLTALDALREWQRSRK